jgi:hypothetical protein
VTTYVKKIRMGMAGTPVRQEGEGEEEEEGGEGQMDQGDQHVARYRPSHLSYNKGIFWLSLRNEKSSNFAKDFGLFY